MPRRPVRPGQLMPARAGRALSDFANPRVRRYRRRAPEEALLETLLACDAALAKVPGIHAWVETV
ncbi:MAG: hypothetical protein OXH99_04175 [Bryobacterales bacterium]|nr:hypothetical protein [Bryobacterales bacterium]